MTDMQVVHKHALVHGVTTGIDLPRGAEIVQVGMQHGTVVMWTIADVEPAFNHKRLFSLVATGQEFDDHSVYCGSVFDGPFVWHVIEEHAK